MTTNAHAAPATTKTAYFAGGCFWCMEPPFDRTAGVLATDPGYVNGREVIRITYDPAQVGFDKLLRVYWYAIDPLDAGGQLYDRGDTYITAIYFQDESERKAAEESKAAIEKELGQPVAPLIQPFTTFVLADEKHHNYYLKNPLHYNAYKLGSGRQKRIEQVYRKKGDDGEVK